LSWEPKTRAFLRAVTFPTESRVGKIWESDSVTKARERRRERRVAN